jgi:peptide/nickel transport system ATP-binding protein/oligopeptide transport system ATP-binding protein
VSLLELKDVNKIHFRRSMIEVPSRRVHAVCDVSFTLERGETLGIVGESGSGKSTLARAMLFLDPPTSGTVRFDGSDLTAQSRSQWKAFRRRAQIVFQDPHGALNPRMRIEHVVAEGLGSKAGKGKRQREQVAELLELVGIDPARMGHYPHEFSGGQKQRIVIARALAVEPELLVLDEPVSNLDVSIQAQIINLLMDLKRKLNLTYVFISHDLSLVGYLSDRIGVMKEGRLVELAAADSLLSAPEHPYTSRLFESAPVYVDRRVVRHNLHTRSAS